MAYEAKPNTGSLFKNDKRTQDTHAHANGSALIDGVEYYVDAWTNTDKNGNKYQSLKFKPKGMPKPARADGNMSEDLDDEIPF
jgi:hypothetical protein